MKEIYTINKPLILFYKGPVHYGLKLFKQKTNTLYTGIILICLIYCENVKRITIKHQNNDNTEIPVPVLGQVHKLFMFSGEQPFT